MNRVHEIVDYVISQGLYCIINVHHDTGADGNGWVSWLKADASNYTSTDKLSLIPLVASTSKAAERSSSNSPLLMLSLKQ